ncbi:MAG TPA: penicillin acylase family protein, partial [Actinomycetospora sp.]|nr:penicillin acylase family protein [Actinomycetospora sp.]
IDYARVARNVLPPGQAGDLSGGRHSVDQIALYDGLTPLGANVTARDLDRYFKSARFGVEGRAERTVRPRAGVRIVRDRWGVPHVYGRTRADVEFGAGWATAEDRGLLLQLLRPAGRIAALDVPGIDAFSFALSGRGYVPSAEAEQRLSDAVALLRGSRDGRQLLADVRAYVAGINAYHRANSLPIPPWTPEDVAAMGALIGAVFGAGGGDETRRSLFLDALQAQLGDERGRIVFDDLSDRMNPEAPTTLSRSFPWEAGERAGTGNVTLDDGSFAPVEYGVAAAPARRPTMSNALLIGRSRSASGRPIFVAGPQTGQFYPQLLMEIDLHGGGIDARGAAFPGIAFYVLIGRGKDYAWSLTSATSDLIDDYVEELCGDDTHYRYQGSCREMGTFDAGVLRGAAGEPDRRLAFRTTVHGPVIGYATVEGVRVAISRKRATRGRELLSGLAWQDLNTNRPRNAREFLRSAAKLEMSFNWFYADDRDIATFSTGRLPLRPPTVDPGLPTRGNGDFEWRGFLPFAAHPQAVSPASGTIVNWNNKPAPGFTAADDQWSYGSVQRVDLLRAGLARRRLHTPASVVGVMNRAATQDLRNVELTPVLAEVLRGGPAPSARAQAALQLLLDWNREGSSRIDRDLDGRIDHPGAAVMEAAWRRVSDAVLSPVLGPLLPRLRQVHGGHDAPAPSANGFGSGWYGYVDKDLRTLLGRPVAGPYRTRFCGGGDPVACRTSLWAAVDDAAGELEAAQGADPTRWRADAVSERIRFAGGLLARTMRFANRPTFQQVLTFDGHRPR